MSPEAPIERSLRDGCACPAPGLSPGVDPARPWHETRLIAVDRRSGSVRDTGVRSLLEALHPGDLLVLNDAATLPASLQGTHHGRPVELRLATTLVHESFPSKWKAVLFGEGDWRLDTDARPAPPLVGAGDRLVFGELEARVMARSSISPRLVDVAFDRRGDALAEQLYARGAPIQYSHLLAPLELVAVQTPYASRPWAVEMPSTGRPLAWPLLRDLQDRGVELAFLTHAAGLSATGDAALDAVLPLAERYEIPEQTVDAVRRARARGGRVLGVGTTVVRALESSARRPRGLRAGRGLAIERISPGTTLLVVDGILTGVHSPGESHYDLLGAFTTPTLLADAHREACRRGYLAHELGDLMLLA